MPDEHFTLLGYEIKIIIKVKHSHVLELNLKCGERRTTHERTVFKKGEQPLGLSISDLD